MGEMTCQEDPDCLWSACKDPCTGAPDGTCVPRDAFVDCPDTCPPGCGGWDEAQCSAMGCQVDACCGQFRRCIDPAETPDPPCQPCAAADAGVGDAGDLGVDADAGVDLGDGPDAMTGDTAVGG
jgi:hypothetical protein